MQESKNSPLSELKGQMQDFYKFTTTRPVAILMVVIGVSVFGYISYKQLPVNLMPDISYPSLTVRTEYAGTAPEEVETTISRPIEQGLGVVDNLVSISSISKAGQSDVILEYSWNTDMNQATADLREKLDQVFLPNEVDRPLILRYDPSLDPIMRLGLYGNTRLTYMRYLAEEDIKRILETIPGVAAVKVKGGLAEEIRVELDEQKLTLIGINIQQVKNRLAQENVNLAGGNLKEGQTEYLVRTLNEFKDVDEIAEVVVGNWNGKDIKVRDIAKVTRTSKDREIITRINSKESVEIEIFKEADANIVDVAKRVKNRVFGTVAQQAFVRQLEAAKKQKADEKKTAVATDGAAKQAGGSGADLRAKKMTNFIAYNLPDGIKIDILSDQSIFIQNSVNEVKNTAVMGGVLAVLVLFVFLRNLTATMIVGLSIPISIVSTFAPMRMFEVSMNIMSLGGLALGIGMLVDNSIVVLESIARCRDEGDDIIRATVRGVSEVGGAVVASTLTTIAVFFPIVFVEGVAGQIFGDMALTVVFSLLASLAVALFLIPMLYSRNSANFVRDVRVGDLLKQNILQYSTAPKIDALLSGQREGGLVSKVAQGGLFVLQTIGLMFWKILQTALALLVAFVKILVLPPLLVSMPVLALLRKIGVVHFKISEVAINFSQNPDWWRITFVKRIWQTFMVFNSLPAFYGDLRRFILHLKESTWRGKIIRGLLFPLSVGFSVIKFLFQYLLEAVFSGMHFFIVVAAVIFKAVFAVGKLLISLPIGAAFAGFNAAYSRLESAYPRLLQWSLHNRKSVLGSVAIGFVFVIFVVAPRLGSELIPEVHQGEFNVELSLPVGTPVETTDTRSIAIENYLSGLDGVAKVAAVSGTDKTANSNTEEGEHTAKLTVTIQRASSVVVQEERIINDVRREMKSYSGINWKISRPVLFSFKTPIEIEIHGYNLQKLQEILRQLEDRVQEIPGVFDVRSNIQRGNPEVQITYNRTQLARYGLNILDVASIVRNKIRGDVATEFKDEDRKIDILVRLREEDKETIDNLRRLVINPNSPKPIPLEAVADISVREGPSEIRRIGQQRTAVITANISGRDLQSVSNDIYRVLQTTDMPLDFSYNLAGQNQEMQTSLNSLKMALALAIFLVYIVMASQFESLIHPLVIIFTIPLALVGVIVFLYILSIPLSIVVFLGIILLAGIVVNNAIVLVDYINQLRARGMEKMTAIIEAGKLRMRPIMMTTLTTVLGLLPMALGLGDGAEIRTPMAITVIVGLITSTLLTLVVIPTVYSLVDRKA